MNTVCSVLMFLELIHKLLKLVLLVDRELAHQDVQFALPVLVQRDGPEVFLGHHKLVSNKPGAFLHSLFLQRLGADVLVHGHEGCFFEV